MKLAGFHNHLRLESGLVRQRGGGTSALSKRVVMEGGVSGEGAKNAEITQGVKLRTLPLFPVLVHLGLLSTPSFSGRSFPRR